MLQHHLPNFSPRLLFMMDPKPCTETNGRLVGGTEKSWCRAVPGGTGITVLALLLSHPIDPLLLRNTLHKLQNSHPILRAKLASTSPNNPHPSFHISPRPSLQLHSLDSSATSDILKHDLEAHDPLHSLLEHELNQNPWSQSHSSLPADIFFATMYSIPDSSSAVVALRFHTSVCDRTSGVTILKELLGLIGKVEEVVGICSGEGDGDVVDGEIAMGIEDLIPVEHSQKPFWARGCNLLGYSLNFMRSANLPFEGAGLPGSSEVVRLELSSEETQKLLSACEARSIKLCGALAAAGLIASISSKHLENNQSETYSVITLVDCRKYLIPAPIDRDLGFYHSAIQNAHTVCEGQELWEVSRRCYNSFSNSMNYNKHLTDMGDLNFLMCKAIENPHLTPSSSMRTALISVFADPVIYNSTSDVSHQQVGVEDYIGCSSVHGVGPSIAIFDTIRDGQLDCACVYPSPLHSKKQMQQLVEDMKKILVDGSHAEEGGELEA